MGRSLNKVACFDLRSQSMENLGVPFPAAGAPDGANAASAIHRTGPEAEALRRRMERPARFGRFLMGGLGAVTAAAGVTAWITHALVVGLALGIFGAVLILLGVIQHVLLRRDFQHWPDQALLWDEGLELVLRNGEVRGATWSDPDLVLHLVTRRARPPAGREYLLVWMMDPRIPAVELSSEGFDRVKKMAESHQLLVSERHRGSPEKGTTHVEIRRTIAGVESGMGERPTLGDIP